MQLPLGSPSFHIGFIPPFAHAQSSGMNSLSVLGLVSVDRLSGAIDWVRSASSGHRKTVHMRSPSLQISERLHEARVGKRPSLVLQLKHSRDVFEPKLPRTSGLLQGVAAVERTKLHRQWDGQGRQQCVKVQVTV